MTTPLPSLMCCLAAILLVVGCDPEHVAESNPADPVVSLLGTALPSPTFDDSTMAQLRDNYEQAVADLTADSTANNFVWVGRRQAYMWRYHEAIDTYSAGLQRYPDSPHLYRHRGHRFVSVRDFDSAVRDLEYAARLVEGSADEVEPDGQPNEYNIPTSTLHFNIYYHLGLAHYLRGDFESAAEAYRKCLAVSRNDDSIVASTDWLYMSLRRLGETEEAAQALERITPDMTILENHSYFKRLMMYKGALPADSLLSSHSELDLATQGYGVGNWHLYNGERDRAFAIFKSVASGSYWPAFGFIAAEAELAREMM